MWCLPVQSGTTMHSQVPLQLGERGKVQSTLHAHILLPFFMLQLMCTKLAGICKASSTNAAAGGTKRRMFEKNIWKDKVH